MLHTLKTLYQQTSKHYPALTEQFEDLREYCMDADGPTHSTQYYRGYGSLKWFIYVMRSIREQREIEDLFYFLLAEAAGRQNEHLLYEDIFAFKTAKQHQDELKKAGVRFEIDDYDIIDIEGFRVLLNNSGQNVTNFIFRDDHADIILGRSRRWQSAAFIFSVTSPALKAFDVQALHEKTNSRNGEAWAAFGGNLVICGGPKSPENKTTITMQEMIYLLKQVRK